MGRRLRRGSRRELENSGTTKGFLKPGKTEPKLGVPGQLTVFPLCAVTQVSPWTSASLGRLSWGPLPLGQPRAGCPATALEDLAFMTYGWQRPGVRFWLLTIKRIVSFSEQCSFTSRELPFPTSNPPPKNISEGGCFLEFVFSRLPQKELYVYLLSGPLHCCVHLSCPASSPPRLSCTLQT